MDLLVSLCHRRCWYSFRLRRLLLMAPNDQECGIIGMKNLSTLNQQTSTLLLLLRNAGGLWRSPIAISGGRAIYFATPLVPPWARCCSGPAFPVLLPSGSFHSPILSVPFARLCLLLVDLHSARAAGAAVVRKRESDS